ncbi:hypothetical protein [Psychromicrobium lacuslunae]|uniref:Histone acetyltransferase Rv0428c-like SH3 domain-containing protein n=1 Tax=Psychromicrobium lacuslunae TaxID=1618207 RepID=A0A0D4BZ47_9MICC|nr:hypothetical protein [Psychromicrobium lacuslunae]AJT41569.1 hypothetical protein UM93_08695 [Psychromicrobium lacuslunae]
MSFLDDIEIGTRIVARYRVTGPLPLTDAVGNLLSRDRERISVETKRGVVTIGRADIVAAKEVPAPPRRRPQ